MLDSLMGKDRNEVKEGARKLSPEEQRRKRLNDPARGEGRTSDDDHARICVPQIIFRSYDRG